MSPDAARRQARARIDKFPNEIDEIWGFAVGPLIFLQAGLVGSTPALIAWIKRRQGHLEVSGSAGLHLAGLTIFALFNLSIIALGAASALGRGSWGLLIAGLAGMILLYAVAWTNHIFRADADHLIHLLRRALNDPDLEREDRRFGRSGIRGASLAIDGKVQDEAPSPFELREAVLNLSNNEFVIISFAEEVYMQAFKSDQTFLLEERRGSNDRHYRAEGNLTVDDVIEAMTAYLLREAYKSRVSWRLVEV